MAERVLIIDDEENIRQMLRLTLEEAGYEVAEAEDGIEAFAILGGDPEWSVVLLDQRLPLMEGTEVLRRIKVLSPLARVVMMTAFASVELAVEAMKLGTMDFLRKPMTPEVVRNSVAGALTKLRQPQAAVENRENPRDQAHFRMVTTNGFTILPGSDVAEGVTHKPNERRFLVRRPDGSEQEVVVEISQEALEEAQLVIHDAPIEKAFWTSQAETFLSDFIWNDGNVPASGNLVLKGVHHDELIKQAQQKGRDERSHTNH